MFNRFHPRFAFQGGDWEDWTPPWRGPNFINRWNRRGFFGPGGPFGPKGPFGPDDPAERFFGRGDLKYVLLDLLQERPMHGYEMIKALEERSHGFYVPSAGSIYPTLQLLEDRELVVSSETNGKKVYSITDAGRAFLAERQQAKFTPPWSNFGPARRWNEPEVQALRTEAMEVARLYAIAGRQAFRDPQKLARLHAITERSRQELSDLIYGPRAKLQQDPPAPPTPPTEQA